MKLSKSDLIMIVVTVLFIGGALVALFFGNGVSFEHSVRIEPSRYSVDEEALPPVAAENEATPSVSSENDEEASSPEAEDEDEKSVAEPININTADETELATLPGIGEELAKRIVLYREQNGDFASLSEITEVSGIGEKTLEEILDYITI